jgi:hypothetical protein
MSLLKLYITFLYLLKIQWLYAQTCQYTVTTKTVSCSGFESLHGKLRLNGVQLVDEYNSKSLSS